MNILSLFLHLLCFYFTSTYPLQNFYYSSTYYLLARYYRISSSQRVILIGFLGLVGNVPRLGTKRSQAGNKEFPVWERIVGRGY